MTSIFGHKYRLAEYASTYHQHVWTARSEMLANYYQTSISKRGELINNSDGSQVIIKRIIMMDKHELASLSIWNSIWTITI